MMLTKEVSIMDRRDAAFKMWVFPLESIKVDSRGEPIKNISKDS